MASCRVSACDERSCNCHPCKGHAGRRLHRYGTRLDDACSLALCRNGCENEFSSPNPQTHEPTNPPTNNTKQSIHTHTHIHYIHTHMIEFGQSSMAHNSVSLSATCPAMAQRHATCGHGQPQNRKCAWCSSHSQCPRIASLRRCRQGKFLGSLQRHDFAIVTGHLQSVIEFWCRVMRSATPNLQLPVAYLCGSVCSAPVTVPCDDAKAALLWKSPWLKVLKLLAPRQDGHKVAAAEVPKRPFSDRTQKIVAQLLMLTG